MSPSVVGSGPFTQTTFMGLSLVEFSSSLGWGETASQLNVTLVADPKLNQSLDIGGGIGTPFHFKFEDYEFQGLLQSYKEGNDPQGRPVYHVVLVGPGEILKDPVVVMDIYRGPVGVDNVLNVFGYWESFGFGGSGKNESGLMWDAIRVSVENMTSGSGRGYGGPISFKGHNYKIDLSTIPTPPKYYRIGGQFASLSEITNNVLRDSGCDYICELDDHTIKFRVISRKAQPSLGQVQSYVTSQPNISREEHGRELRNEITSTYIFGGYRQDLCLVKNTSLNNPFIIPFWGFDSTNNNQPLVGQGIGNSMSVTLDISPISQIVGYTKYTTTVMELRFCLNERMDSWMWYITATNQPLSTQLNIPSIINPDLTKLKTYGDFFNNNPNHIKAFAAQNANDTFIKLQIIYDFLHKVAEEYYGRQWLIAVNKINGLPFEFKVDPDTQVVTYSDVPSDDGGYMEEGALPLGLNSNNYDLFQDATGKFGAFVHFDGSTGKIEPGTIDPQASIIQGTDIYMHVEVDKQVYFVNGVPAVLVKQNHAVVNKADHPLFGDINTLAQIAGTTPSKLIKATNIRTASVPLTLFPEKVGFDAIALPMKSNRECYGPWGKVGVAGMVHMEQIESLTPWNYGSYAIMNLAADALVSDSATQQQESEMGTVELAGAPQHSLGEELAGTNANITNINVSIGARGVTTQYQLKTYTRSFGVFGKSLARQIQKQGLQAMRMRQALRQALRRSQYGSNWFSRSLISFMTGASVAVRQQTPHQILLGFMTEEPPDDPANPPSTPTYNTEVTTSTIPEGLANCNADDDNMFALTGGMSMDGLLRPFSVDPNNENIPHYEDTQGDVSDAAIDIYDLDPFQEDNDIQYYLSGDSYTGFSSRASGVDPTTARPLALRFPPVGMGWGFELTGKPVPNSGELDSNGDPQTVDQWDDDFPDGYLKHPEGWKVGPIEYRWDKWRKIWTFPTILMGRLDEELEKRHTDGVDGGPVDLFVWNGERELEDSLSVYNHFSNKVKKDTDVVVTYYPLAGKWYVTSANCNL
jgi:hypothetical protein